MLEPALVAQLVDRVGADQVLLGSDHPFPWEPNPMATVREAGLSDAEERAMLGETAVGLFGL